jgi:repressor LexA
MQKLSPRQETVLTYIRAHIAAHGYPPTLREIGAHMGIRSTNAVNDHLLAIERKGHIRRSTATSRGITLAGFDASTPQAPLEARLRVALRRYSIMAVEGERVVTDLAAELAVAISSSSACA